MKNTRTVSKGRLREGQPLSMRASGRPTGKRPFNAGIEGSKELTYLRKALTALGAEEVDRYSGGYNGVYVKGGTKHNQMWSDTVEVWSIKASDRVDGRTQALNNWITGSVHINKKGEVSYEFNVYWGDTFSKSLQRIFKRVGLGNFHVEHVKDERTGNANGESSYSTEDGFSEETPFNYISGTLSLSEAAVAFNKLAKVLSAANASYENTKAISDTPEHYFTAKGEIADPNSMEMPFKINRDSDGSTYIYGCAAPSGEEDGEFKVVLGPEQGDWTNEVTTGDDLLDAIVDILNDEYCNMGKDPNYNKATSISVGGRFKSFEAIRGALEDIVTEVDRVIEDFNAVLSEDEYEDYYTDTLELDCDGPYEQIFLANDARKKKLAKMSKNAANDAAHRYESVMRHIRSIKESSQWNRETNPYAKAAFDAVFNLIDSSYIDLDQAEDDMMEEEYRAENNEMFQNVLQGIYHALEQFIPQVNEIFGPDGLDIIFGDNLYDLSI